MAHYRTTIRTPLGATEAFAYMADLRNLAEWDPGVDRVTQITGTGGGAGTEFDVVVDTPGPGLTLRYVTEEFDPPRHALVRAESRVFTSIDRIEVTPDGDGSLVTYAAELQPNGPLGVAGVVLRPVFDRIGRRAERGLRDALSEERV